MRRGSFGSVPELIAAIEEYLAASNANPKQFVWHASAQAILDKLAHCKAIYETLHQDDPAPRLNLDRPYARRAHGHQVDLLEVLVAVAARPGLAAGRMVRCSLLVAIFKASRLLDGPPTLLAMCEALGGDPPAVSPCCRFGGADPPDVHHF